MREFQIAAAQVPSIRGEVQANIAAHFAAVKAAAANGVTTLVFPELSLTGYEPDLASALAFEPADARLAPLRDVAVAHNMTLLAGAPIRNGSAKPFIGLFVIAATGAVTVYRKMHLGSIEAAHFTPGHEPLLLADGDERIGVAICADSCHRSHPQTYSELGASIYAAGVFFTEEWYVADAPVFHRYAADFAMLSVMANHGASTGTYRSAGKSAIWAPGGSLVAQVEGIESALVTATFSAGHWGGGVIPISPAAI